MSEISSIIHSEFRYIFIPCDISSDVQICKFSGEENDFKNKLKLHFQREIFYEKDKKEFSETISKKYKNYDLNETQFHSIIDETQIQIIPLTLPTAANNYEAVNCYIDSVGRLKHQETNARASRICSTDIRGDCFISKTFDDEEEFKRIDFTLNDYEVFLKSPPSSKNRWSQESAMQQILNQTRTSDELHSNTTESAEAIKDCCSNCNIDNEGLKEMSTDGKKHHLMECSRCHRVKYCSKECQRQDWRYHKRICY